MLNLSNRRIERMTVGAVLLCAALIVILGVTTAQAQSGLSFNQVVHAGMVWDATPNPDGTVIYFTAVGAEGAGVYSVPAAGGDITTVAAGDPFVSPLGIAVTTDGNTLYVTDPWAAGVGGNALFSLSLDGVVTAISGTSGTAPQGVEVASVNGADHVYYTGIDATDGLPAVYRLSSSGVAELLAKGSPLVAPSGVAIGADETVYVLDRLASGGGLGSVLRIQGGAVEVIAADVRTGGQLAGLTLTGDGSTLLVSSLDSAAGTSQVLVIDVATLGTSIINDVIGVNTAAGGLHRAHNVNIFAWADIRPPRPFPPTGGTPPTFPPGGVYVIG